MCKKNQILNYYSYLNKNWLASGKALDPKQSKCRRAKNQAIANHGMIPVKKLILLDINIIILNKISVHKYVKLSEWVGQKM